MYFAQIELPCHLNAGQLSALAESIADIAIGNICKRIDNDDNKPWLMEWYFEEQPDAGSLTSRLSIQIALGDIQNINVCNDNFKIGAVVEENWLEKVYQEHKPFSVGPFFIYGSHYEGEVPDGQIGILIDAATAFGSGDHGTTKGCLQAMLDLKAKGICPWNVLDMGTGSGILSIAAWKLWNTPISAIDIDAESVRVAKHYQERNGVADGQGAMQCETGDGFNTKLVQTRKPFDMIIANILAGPLIEMASDLKAVSDVGGYIILSGMLKTQADDVRKAYEAQGFTSKDRYDIDKWSSLVLQNT